MYVYNTQTLRGERKAALIMKTPAHSQLPACKTFNIEILQL